MLSLILIERRHSIEMLTHADDVVGMTEISCPIDLQRQGQYKDHYPSTEWKGLSAIKIWYVCFEL